VASLNDPAQEIVRRCDCVDENKHVLPDGMKFDRDGNLFASGPGGLQIFAPDGTHLGGIEFDGRVSNCKWGDDDSVLYTMANMRSIASK
jgi:gluconolactonase